MPDIRQLFLASSKAQQQTTEELAAAPATLHAAWSCTEHLTRSLLLMILSEEREIASVVSDVSTCCCRAVVDTGLHGRMSSKHEVSLSNLQWSSYQQVADTLGYQRTAVALHCLQQTCLQSSLTAIHCLDSSQTFCNFLIFLNPCFLQNNVGVAIDCNSLSLHACLSSTSWLPQQLLLLLFM